MAYGKRFDEWDRASLLAALIHNDPQGYRKRLQPADFNPLATEKEKSDEAPMKITVADLAAGMGGKIATIS
jgi:hypothetical protein